MIFVSSTTPIIVDLCNSPVQTQLRRTPRRTAGTLRMVGQAAEQIDEISTSAALRTANSAVKITNSSPSKRNRINGTNVGINPIKCAVCLEHPNEKKPTSTICGHIFCETCIKMAIIQSKKCPLCKKKLSVKSIHPIYF